MANIINFNDDDKSKQAGGDQPQAGASASITPVSAFNAQQSVPQAQQGSQPASSGQFTNIQKYLQANKGAGQQVAGGINKQMDKSLQPGQIQQEDATKAFQSSVQQANDVLGRGQGYSQQLQAPVKQTQGIIGTPAAPGIQPVNAQQVPQEQAFDPSSLVNDQQKLVDFTKIRTGQGVDEEALRNSATQAQNLAANNQMTGQNLLDQTKSTSGRAGLVSQAFNRPNYTQGQQKLDTLFLTGAGKQGINAVQDQAKQNLGKLNDTFNQSTAGVNQAGDIGTREKTLQDEMQNRANALESGYISNLQGLMPQVNQMRDAEKARWQNNFDILTGKKQGTIDNDIFNEYALHNGEHSYNVLNDPNLTLRQIANVSDRNAENVQDVSTQGDVDYYKMLAQLSKGNVDANGNFVAPTSDQLQLKNASDLERATAAKVGEGSLRSNIDKAQQNFIDNAIKSTITGYGTDTGSNGIFGGGSDAHGTASVNLAQYLNNLNLGTSGANSTNRGDYSQLASYLNNPGFTLGNSLFSGITGGPNITGSVGNMINSMTGASSGSQSKANYDAQNDLIRNLFGTLQGQGYNNYVTTTGNKNVDDLVAQQRNAAIDKVNILDRDMYGYKQLQDPGYLDRQTRMTANNSGQLINQDYDNAEAYAKAHGITQDNLANLLDRSNPDIFSQTPTKESGLDTRGYRQLQDYLNIRGGVQDQYNKKLAEQSGWQQHFNDINTNTQNQINARLGINNNDISTNDTTEGGPMSLAEALQARLGGK